MDITEIAKKVRKQLKAEFPECRFSVRIERYSMGQSMSISLMKAPFAAFAKTEDVNGNQRTGDYAQLNQFQLRREPNEYICNGLFLTPDAWRVMKRADEIQSCYNWDNSDSMTDYFDVNFYFHPEIGQWNKPFEVV